MPAVTGAATNQPVAVLTGANGGIGKWIALGLARSGYHVILIVRDLTRGEAIQSWVGKQVSGASTELVAADLSLMSATRQAGLAIALRHPRIALLINNAGVFEVSRMVTNEGCERVLATNHLSPFVLTQTLLPALRKAAPSRIVAVGSSTSDSARIDPDDLPLVCHWTMRRAYSRSKLALMMATFAFARRLEGTGITANVVHPGLVSTRLVRAGGIVGMAWRFLARFAVTEEQGAAAPLYVALAPELASVSGRYFKGHSTVLPNGRALDPVLLEHVWQTTERLVDQARGHPPA